MKGEKKLIKIMKRGWEEKESAREDLYSLVETSKEKWDKEGYYQKGAEEVSALAISFLKGKHYGVNDLKKMKALDIGCGTGRLSVALAKYFGLVDGVDISEKMIETAKRDNKDVPNLKFYINNGVDLKQFSDNTYDFVFSYIVFQHIPRRSVVINYLKEIHRVLKPGGLMKIQVRGYPGYLPLGLASWRYKGFDSFFAALSEIRRVPFMGLPIPKIKKYDTGIGAFFQKNELEKIVRGIGYSDIGTLQTKEIPKYLWVSGKK